MTFKTLLKLTVATLPIALAACADSASEIRARYGDSTWTAEELTSTPYDRGRLHFTAGRFGLAVQQFELAIGQDPDSVEALNGLAASFDQLQRFELAERYYLRALNLDPENAQTLNNLGISYLMQRRYDLALAHLQDAYARDPMNDMVLGNLQQAEAGLELDSQSFLASAVGSAEFADVAAAPRSLNLRTQENDGESPGEGEIPALVRIEALALRDDIWVERSSAAVQTLVTQPNADLLAAMRDAGLSPRIANFRNQAAVASLQTQPTPWQSTHVMIAEAMVERELMGAVRQDRLADDLSAGPDAGGGSGIGDLPRLSATVIGETASPALSDLPQLSATVIDSATAEEASAAVPSGDQAASADDLGGLTQLSAALIGGDEPPAEDETPPVDTENLVMRQEAAVGYEPVVRRSGPSPGSDLPAPAPDSDDSPVIEVSNGTGRSKMATRIGDFLQSEGLTIGRLTNAEHFSHQETVIFYRREWLRQAQELAAHFPVDVSLEVAHDQTSDIKIRLGGDLLNFDQGLFYASRESSAKSTG